jgi:hypothetical protein
MGAMDDEWDADLLFAIDLGMAATIAWVSRQGQACRRVNED